MKRIKVVFNYAVLFAIVVFMTIILACSSVQPSSVYALESGEQVYLGGFNIGISLDADGLIIQENGGVNTEYGTMCLDSLKVGDVIKSVNGIAVKTADDLQSAVDNGGKELELGIMRNNSSQTVLLKPLCELYTGKYMLGVTVEEKINGIGTVTYIKQDGTFGALGHEITDSCSNKFDHGSVYNCKLLGIKKGKKGEAGAILASITGDELLGSITANNKYGIYGKMNSTRGELYTVASRDEIKSGAAQIVCSPDGVMQKYDIEIVRAVKQSKRKIKGLVYRVTDKRLLDLCGGIVQGMSGSPIIQNGKLIGAVTHVFLNDSTKGYGVYCEFMD